MDTASVFRVISLIPDRMPRSPSGSAFDGASSERAELLSRFLGWLGPLTPISKDEQQLFDVRAPATRPLLETDAEAADDAGREARENPLEEQPVGLPGAKTHIPA